MITLNLSRNQLSWFLAISISVFWYCLSINQVFAQTSSDIPFPNCIDPGNLPTSWQSHFPFDLVYPIGLNGQPIDTSCTSITLWGVTRQLCSVMQLAQMLKNVFLLKLVIQSLLTL